MQNKAHSSRTYYHIILDQSGSMQDCIGPTLSGFNEQLQVLRSLEGRYPEQTVRVGLTRFNHEVLPTFYARPPASVLPLDRHLYQPDGTTALYDAIGTTVLQLKERVGSEIEEGLATAVVVILTDGHENASRIFSLPGIRNLIRELEATGKWTFSYLGATIDAVEIAEALNIRKENSMAFDKGAMQASYNLLNESMDAYLQERRKGAKVSGFLKKGRS